MPFNIGPGELLLLAVVALLLFGPRRLPEIGKSVGEGIASFKRAMNTMTEVPAAPAPRPARPKPAVQPALPAQADPAPEGAAAMVAEPSEASHA